MPIIEVRDAQLAYGHTPLLENANLLIEAKERVCLIGRNGTGKSSLMSVISGMTALDGGQVWRQDGLKISQLAQEVPRAADETLFDTVVKGLGKLGTLLAEYQRLTAAEADAQTLQAIARTQAQIDAEGGWDVAHRVAAVLSRLQLPSDVYMSQCSGGVRRRTLLAQALVSTPDLLLLDEPTNHLDIDAIVALEKAVAEFPGAVLFISHDRAFCDRLATRIVELDRGRLTSYPGSFVEYQRRKAEALDAEAEQNRKFDKKLAAEEVWIRQGIKARRTRNEGRVRKLQALRQERSARLERQGRTKLALDRGEESGKLVLEARDVSFAYDGSPLIAGFSTTIQRGDRVGIIGPNGSGKSTLLKLLLGQLAPSSGTVRLGTQLQVAYFDQERAQIDPEKSVRENLALGSDRVEIGNQSRHVMGYLADFLFPPERAQSPASSLSGGERNRLLLAKLFTQPANLLVLDEPTNDLDVETLELLEELLLEFDGTLLLVSHDRSFLDRTVSSTLVLEPSGQVSVFVGGYSDWQRQVAAKKADDARAERPSQTTNAEIDSTPRSKRANRLGYKEQRELTALPAEIERLEAEQSELSAQLTQSDFYQQASAVIDAAHQQLQALNDALEAKYQRWAELEERNGG